MVLHINSGTSLLSGPGANRITGGYHYLSNKSGNTINPPVKNPPLNWPIHMECTTMRNVLYIIIEAELVALFFKFPSRCSHAHWTHSNGPQKTTHPSHQIYHNRQCICQQQHPPTYIPGYLYDILLGQVQSNISSIFLVYWVIVEHNVAEYFTKLHPIKHHCLIRRTYVFPTEDVSNYACYISPNALQGCVGFLPA